MALISHLLVILSMLSISLALSSSSSSSSPSSLSSLPPTSEATPLRCDACKFAIKLIQDVEEGKVTREIGESVATTFCELNHGGLGYSCEGTWQCKDVCSGAVGEFAPIVLEVAGQKYLNPETVCTKIGACNASLLTHRLPRLRTPTPESEHKYKPTGGPILRVAHITDIHHDPEYQPGLNTNCGEPICCRPPDGPAPNATSLAGTFGDYNCDTPPATMALLMRTLTQLNPDVVFLTGDDPPHNVWRQSQEFNANVSMTVSEMVARALPGKPVFPVLGNHNGFPVNQFRADPSLDRSWLYEPLAATYRRLGWLDDQALASFENAGFYTALISGQTKLRVVVLNSNFHSTDNFWLWVDESDIAGMFAWLASTLAAARAADEKVFLMAHHPSVSLYANYSDLFHSIVVEYADVITSIFNGHDHRDYFQIYFSNYTDAGVPVAVSYIPSAMNPQDTRNPSFRILDVDSVSGQVLDFHEYRLDLARQGLINNVNVTHASFELVYSARDTYNMSTLSPSEWYRVVNRLKNDDTLFQTYFLHYLSGVGDGAFTPQDRKEQICSLLSVTPSLYDACTKKEFVAMEYD